jgi:transmembrane sensor
MVHEATSLDALKTLQPGEAAAYLVARRAEGFTPAEQQLLAGWLALDGLNRRAYESAERAWNSFENARGDEILAAMRAHALASRAKAWRRWVPVAAAAAIVLVGIASALLLNPVWNPSMQQLSGGRLPSHAPIQYASARGELKEIALPDGSSMTLDASSIAVGSFDLKDRKVRLQQGRAFFAVKPDPSRAFSVEAGGRTVIAVGTHFDVNLLPNGVSVTLLEGHVQIRSANPAQRLVSLEPGQQYLERDGAATVRPLGAGAENATAWRQGLINFDDQLLGEAVAVMNRYSREQIVMGDAGVGSIRVSGQFRAGDTPRFAATLADLHQLIVRRRMDQIELLRQK